MNIHLKRVLILLLVFTFVFQMAGITSLQRVSAYADDEVVEASEIDQAEEEVTSEDTAGAPEETITEEEPPGEPEEPAEDPETVPEEPAEVVEEAPDADTLTVEEPAEEPAAEAPALRATSATKAEKTGTVLAFTSDTHNKSGNTAANRLGSWITKVEDIHGTIDVMAFGGDMAGAGASNYWDLTQADFNMLAEKNVPGVYTTGNHEISAGGDFSYSSYTSGSYSSTETKGQFELDKEVASGDDYRIYALGSHTSSSSYSDQITSLTDYLDSVGNDKVIFIITHFPLHYFSNGMSRTTTGASDVIDVLNNAVTNNDQTIVFLWGHNHTLSDTYYDQIYGPGGVDTIEYASGKSKTIKFYYGGAGCMSDSENSPASFVKGKGLVATITQNRGNATLAFTYYGVPSDSGVEDVTEETSVRSVDVTVPDSTVSGYVITIGDYALSANATEDQLINNNGAYIYSGLAGVPYTAGTTEITTDLLWQITPSGDGYLIQSLDGKYLSATYAANGSSTSNPTKGDLFLADTEDVWKLDGTFEAWTGDGTKLSSTNSGKYLTYYAKTPETGSNKTDISLFTIGSSKTNRAQTSVITEAEVDAPAVAVTGVTVSPTTAEIKVGKTTKLTATVEPSDATNKKVVWSSSDETVATVSNGTVTGVKEGTVTITATSEADETISGSCTVTVNPSTDSKYELVDGLEADGEYLIVNTNAAGSAYALKNPGGTSDGVSIADANYKTAVTIESGNYIMTSDDDIVWTATANGDGFNLTNGSDYLEGASNAVRSFNPQKYSTRYWTYNSSKQLRHINPSSTNSYYTLRYSSSNYFTGNTTTTTGTVYLFKKVSSTPVAVTGLTLTPETTTVEAGNTTTLTATVVPSNATNKTITWASSDETVATVSNGTVTGVKEGTTKITATTADGGFSKTCAVEVKASTKTKYILTDKLEAGNYLIVSSSAVGSAYAMKNPGATSSGASMGSVDVTIGSGNVILNSDSSIVWKSTANTGSSITGFDLTNNGGYLEGKSRKVLIFSSQQYPARCWTYDGTHLEHKGGSYYYEVYYNNGFTYYQYQSSASPTHQVYLFKEVTAQIDVTGVELDKKTLTLTEGETDNLTATVTPADATNKSVTWETSDASVATVANGVVTAEGVGTATITVRTAEGNFTDTCEVSVTAAPSVDYVPADTLVNSKDYLIANGDTGSVYIVSNDAGSSRQLKGIATTVANDTITIPQATASKTAFTAEIKTSDSGTISAWLKNGSQYLYADNSSGLRLSSDQTTSSNTGKFWHYKGGSKNLLWYFKDTSTTDGYTDTSSTNKYYVDFSNGNFTDTIVTTTSLADTNNTKMYLFVKADQAVPATGVTLDPKTASVDVGKTTSLTATVTPSTATYAGLTWTSSDTAVATVSDGVVTGVAGGTATITATTKSGETDTCTVTVTVPVVNRYVKVDSLKAGGEYIITNDATVGGSSTRALKNPGGTSSGVQISSSNGKTTVTILDGNIIEIADTDIVWTATENGTTGGFYLTNNGDYLEVYQQALRVFSSEPKQAARYWTYNVSEDTNAQQLRHKGGNSTYALYYNNGTFAASSSTTNKVYLFEKVTDTPHTHTYGDPTWSWAADHSSATATFACECGDEQTVTDSTPAETVVTAAGCETDKVVKYTATVTFNETVYTDTTENITLDETATGHDYGAPVWTWDGVTAATATFTCANDASHQVTKNANITNAQGTGENEGHTVYTATVVFEEGTYTDTKAVINQYTLTFKNGDEVVATITEDYGTAITAPAAPAKPFYTFDGWTPEVPATMPAENKTFNATWTAKEAYYLVGSMNNWTVSENYEFVANAQNSEEYSVSATLTAGDEIKVVKAVGGVANDADYYPSTEHPGYNNWTGNYVVDQYHAGNVTVYFRPAGNFSDAGWQGFGGFFYIEGDHAITVTTSPENAGTAQVVRGDGTEAATSAPKGMTLTVNTTPADNYQLDKIEIWKTSGGTAAEQTLTGNTFEMPDYDVTVKVYFKVITWTFVKFTWEETATGYTAVANYTGDDGSTKTVAATVTYQTTQPGCETAGKTVYTANVTAAASLDGQPKEDTKEVTIPATGHAYGDLIAEVAATCTADGVKAHYECGTCHMLFDENKAETTADALKIPKSGHDWNAPTYVWADDHTSVTATRTCKNDPTHVETDTAAATSEVTKAATCTETGVRTWTSAAFSNTAFEAQTTTETIPVTDHVYGDLIAEVAATCTADGVKAHYECGTCHMLFDTDKVETTADALKIPKSGHDWNAPTYVWADDHTSVTATRTCKNDPTHVETDTAAATSEVTKAATCTETGVRTWTSAAFSNTAFEAQTTTETIPVTDHVYGDLIAEVAATCTADGVKAHYECGTCHRLFDENKAETTADALKIPAAGHKPQTVAGTPATCTESGLTDGSVCSVCHEVLEAQATINPLGHSWNFPTYVWADDNSSVTATRTCKNDASHTETETASTTYGVITPATEDEAGLGRYTSAAFSNSAFTVQSKDVEIPPTGFTVSYAWADDFSSVTGTAVPNAQGAATIKETVTPRYSVKTEPTCTETGTGLWTATFTKSQFTTQTREVEIPAAGHNTTHHDAVAATCTEDGTVEYYSCSGCGKNFSDAAGTNELTTIVEPAKGHDLTHHAAVAAKCGVAGNIEYWQCETCGKLFGDEAGTQEKTASEIVTPALSHNYEAEVTTAPTCEGEGVRTYTCSLCGDTYTEAIPATGHDWGEVQYTWSSDNSKVTAKRVCATDPAHVETETVSTTSETLVEATCVTDGKVRYTSAEFENKAFEVQKTEAVVKAEGHKAADPVHENEKAATCTAGGHYDEVVYCSVCGEELSRVQKTVDALGHDFSEWTVTKAATCTENGEEESTCSRCTAKNTRELAALGHKWDAGKVTKEPTYRTDGEMTYTCTVCGATYTEPIPKQGWKRDSNNNWNYINPDGSKATGWKQVGDYWYYMDKAGIMQTGWTKVGNKWYYMNKNGAMQTGWQKIGGKWYYFNTSGAMLTGWQEINGKTYYFKSSGVMADKEWVTGYWWINAGGTWTYKYRAKWEKTSDGHWMFKATNGWTAKSTTIIINDVSYTFDANGYML